MRKRSFFAAILLLTGLFFGYYSNRAYGAASNEEFAKGYSLNPALYDIWHGKKDRIYLNGPWRFQKTSSNKELADSTGISKGYWKKGYDDSVWSLYPVPWNWNFSLPQADADYSTVYNPSQPLKQDRIGGTGWYRKEFELPAVKDSRRVLLFFEHADEETAVWVNGEKAGEHKNFIRTRWRTSFEPFSFDITRYVSTGKNTLAVQVFDTARSLKGGLSDEVFLEIVPEIYLKQALVTPDIGASEIRVKAFVINAGKQKRTADLSAEVCPWSGGIAYSVKERAPSVSKSIGSFVLTPGENEMDFTVRMEKPVLWSLENPFLYHFKLFNGQKRKKFLIGQERFGFREFKVEGKYFYLNGKRTMLFGLNSNPWYGRTEALLPRAYNQGRFIEKWLAWYKECNIIYQRFHNGRAPNAVYHIADEVGTLICNEVMSAAVWVPGEGKHSPHLGFTGSAPSFPRDVFNGGKISDEYTGKMRNVIYANYNHPSVVIQSLGNELYDTAYASPWGPFLNRLYDAFKRYDLFRPVTSSSGLDPRSDGLRKADYYDIHDYTGMHWTDWTHLEDSTLNLRQALIEYSWGAPEKPYINGECVDYQYGHTYWKPDWFTNLQEIMPSLSTNRAQYVDMMDKVERDHFLKAVRYLGIRNALDSEFAPRLLAEGPLKGSVEIFRRNQELIQGFGLQSASILFPDNVWGGSQQWNEQEPQPLFYVLKRVCNPVFVCMNGFDRNLFAGGTLQAKVFVLNDSPDEQKVLQVKVEISDDSGKVFSSETLPAGTLENSEKKIIEYSYAIPSNLKTGTCRIYLSLTNTDNQVLSDNEYVFFVLGEQDNAGRIATNKKIGLYQKENAGGTAKILDALEIPYQRISGFDALEKYDVVIIGANALSGFPATAGDMVRKWLEGGGRLVCFEQNAAVIPWIPGGRILGGYERIFADLIVPEHPVFEGLSPEQWSLWDGGHREIYKHFVRPFSESVLAAGTNLRLVEMGMVVSEIKLGKGICLMSQPLATERYGQDSAATKYIQNLLKYTLSGKWTDEYAGIIRTPEAAAAEKKPADIDTASRVFEVDKDKMFFVDLRPFANVGFRDEVECDNKGGWTDQGGKDMRHLPVGIQTLRGVPFDIIDPDKNSGKSCIVLKNGRQNLSLPANYLKGYPVEVKGIPVWKEVTRLFFLVSVAWCPPEGEDIAQFVIRYSGGSIIAPSSVFTLKSGIHLRDWTSSTLAELPESVVGWSKRHPLVEQNTTLYIVEVKEPQRGGVTVAGIDFTSTGTGIPALIAVTGETR